MNYLPVNSALYVMVGPAYDGTDFSTPEEAIAYDELGMDVELVKQSTALGLPTATAITPAASGNNHWAHVSQGTYALHLTAAQNNVLGKLRVNVQVDGVLAFRSIEYTVITADAWEERIAGGMAKAVLDALKTNHNIADTIGEILQAPQVVTGGAINSEAIDYTLNAGTLISGTRANTAAADGVEHVHASVGGNLDLVYEINIGGNGIPNLLNLLARLNSTNDSLSIQAWDWTGPAWDTRAIFAGQGGATNVALAPKLLQKHVGTGGDLGKIRIRFYGTGLTSATLYIDELLASYAVVNETLGYDNGAVWFNSLRTNTNTKKGVDGTSGNPVSTITALRSLMDQTGLKRAQVAAGSTVTLDQAFEGYEFRGIGYALDVNGQSISGTYIEGATIVGNDSGTNPSRVHYQNCKVNSSTLGLFKMDRCQLGGNLVLAEAGDYFMDRCSSEVAGTGTPSIDVGAGLADINLSMRHHSGGNEFRNLGQSGTDNVSMEGHGQAIAAASCVGGVIAARGNFPKTDNSTGAKVTWSEDGRVTVSSITDVLAHQDSSKTYDPATDSLEAIRNWVSGSPAGSREITINVKAGGQNVQGVKISVYDQANTALQGTATTDANGNATFYLDDATYSARLQKQMYSAASYPEVLVVTADATVPYTMTQLSPSPPSSPEYCVIYGTVEPIGNRAAAGAVVSIQSVVPQVTGDIQLAGDPEVTVANEVGYFEIEIKRTVQALVTVPVSGLRDVLRTVPDLPQQLFADWV